MKECVAHFEGFSIVGYLATGFVIEQRVPEDERKVGVGILDVFISPFFDACFDVVQASRFWDHLLES